jgi:hypothetical protein
MKLRVAYALLAILAVATPLAGCGADGAMTLTQPAAAGSRTVLAKADDLPVFDPTEFVPAVTNLYFPLPVGRTWTYRSEGPDEVETIVVEVLPDTKIILGTIQATVVRDRVYVDGVLVEDTFDWFAQDVQGNVWYLGEDVTNYENGVPVDKAGSWEAGMNGATAGIIMLADPEPGDRYAQESLPGIAEDQARVRRVDETVTVPYGTFHDVIQILEWTPLEPGQRGDKFYAPGVGIVLETEKKERVELISVTGP